MREPATEAPTAAPDLPPHQAAALHGQQTAGNDAMSSYFAGLAGKFRVIDMTHTFPFLETKVPPGLDVKGSVAFKGEFGARGGEGDTGVTVSGPATSSSPKGAGMSLAKAELERKFASDVKLKGSLEGSPSGVTPSLEISGPTGVAGTSVRAEFAPIKITHDMEKGKKVSLAFVKLTGRLPFEFAGEDLYVKGSADLVLEMSLDAVEGVKSLVKQYGTATRGEALAWAGAEAGIFAMLVGGAALVGLDFADEERREQLWNRAFNRAQQVVNAETIYLTELGGHQVAAAGAIEQLAQREAREQRAKMAKNLALDEDLVSCIIRNEQQSIVPFRWRDAALDDLIRKMEKQLDEYAEAHPLRTLWGLRIREDKTRVNRIIDDVREGGGEPQIRQG